jgi:hypothetical protein
LKPSSAERRSGCAGGFAEKRDVIRRMAREALEEDDRGETLPLDDLL